ncbi:CLUMA_CG000392, isoform A [Clunio marinus]|uniref:CLUMA_CG000392, isoform A n=1 Tax=Clunio marinus TaxID=568069 RepID=A0A1J1HF28_9DIPT|nr:CLUMA_CG000392, isoform A [Clunio marinus]
MDLRSRFLSKSFSYVILVNGALCLKRVRQKLILSLKTTNKRHRTKKQTRLCMLQGDIYIKLGKTSYNRISRDTLDT